MTEKDSSKTYIENKGPMLLDSLILGLVTGLVVSLYRLVLGRVEGLRDLYFFGPGALSPLIVLAIFLALSLGMAALLRWAPFSGGSGIPQILGELEGALSMEAGPTLVSKFLGGCMAGGGGLALGREGPSIQMGGVIGKGLGQVLRRPGAYSHFLITWGASAGLSAAFNAPLAGVFFALEEVHGSWDPSYLLPCLIASVSANFVSFSLLGMDHAFSFTLSGPLPMAYLWVPIAIGVLTGLAGLVFNRGLIGTQAWMGRVKLATWAKIFLVMVLALGLGQASTLILGGGHGLIEDLAASPSPLGLILVLFLVRLVFLWLSYGTGAQGGIFLPSLVLGTLVGALAFKAFPIEGLAPYYENFLYLGMAGILASVVQSPILAIILVSEMAGSLDQFISISLAVAVSYLVARGLDLDPIYHSLYEGLKRKLGK